jgi:hypothetical protein
MNNKTAERFLGIQEQTNGQFKVNNLTWIDRRAVFQNEGII